MIPFFCLLKLFVSIFKNRLTSFYLGSRLIKYDTI